MIEVIKSGLETSIQDWPGRFGYWNQGFPPSGPMDSWSFRLANVLVGNKPGEAALECQFIGPTLKFQKDSLIAVTGSDMQPTLDGEKIAMWESIAVRAGQTLLQKMGLALILEQKSVLVRSTFHKAGRGACINIVPKP